MLRYTVAITSSCASIKKKKKNLQYHFSNSDSHKTNQEHWFYLSDTVTYNLQILKTKNIL